MLIVFRLLQRVDTWLAEGGRVPVPRPVSCPVCGGDRLVFDGWRPRATRSGPVAIQRVICVATSGHGDGLGRSHSMVPDVMVSGRVDLASVIGQGLAAKASGAGHRAIGQALGVPAGTVRGWLRRARTRGMQVAGRLLATAAAAEAGGRDPPATDVFTTVVAAAHAAARAYARLSGEPVAVWPYAAGVCGSRLLG